ncbi:DUF6207 family protein [Streptomyces collinus]|uniref:DUF6207 family protein n=1 Tax=Streptomyces collinus TaxID=42684 RepID=UPI0036BD4667
MVCTAPTGLTLAVVEIAAWDDKTPIAVRELLAGHGATVPAHGTTRPPANPGTAALLPGRARVELSRAPDLRRRVAVLRPSVPARGWRGWRPWRGWRGG